jgi:hypothetical protein
MIEAQQPTHKMAVTIHDPLKQFPEVVLAEVGSIDPHHEQWNKTVRAETPQQRVDRNYHEILQEVRVAQIGVQALFAFLLSCAFSQRFPGLSTYQHALYVIAFLLTVMTASLFMAPAAYHRVLFRLRMKGHIVDASNRFFISGLVALVFAMATGLLLVLDMVAGHLLSAVLTIAVVAWFGCWWYAVPMTKRIRRGVPRHPHKDR